MEPFQSSADGPRKIHHAGLRSAFNLSDSDGSRVVAAALGEFQAARRSAGSDERSPYDVVERSLTPPAIVRYSFKDFQEAVRLADGEAGQQKVFWTSPKWHHNL